ncbi:MAG: MarR family transcriptional regulator [Nisaea sp.]|uniref:MarR family winged helix-turn-helix transcriptional regulator n=1 Tax=Nisaea sp. TaxID=2024842 RepID=UPI001B29AFBF|nr:MarR family transcriptional regulator [Nisaea sp.]MBO6561315.1 MarR family transcriptional regulator [Nisaea sp.]
MQGTKRRAMADETNDLPDSLFLVSIADEAGGEAQETLSFRRTPTVLLTFAANRFTRSAARHYQERFGIGAMDWRMLVMLTREPGSSVSHAARTIGIDKAAVSRCLKRLEADGLAAPDDSARRRDWYLTAKGHALHAEVLDVALERQRKLLDGFSEEDVGRLNGYLARFLDNLDALNGEDREEGGSPQSSSRS